MALPLRQIRMDSRNPDLTVFAFLAADHPELTDGYGGWEVIPRPRRRAYTRWMGTNPFRLRLSLIIDKYQEQDSIEHICQTLERMATSPDAFTPPPLVDVDGAVPHPRTGWVIDNLEWGQSIRHPNTLNRLRQEVVVHLLQHVPVDVVQQNNPPPSKYRIYTVKKGDTLGKIASKLLGNWRRWKEIAKINKIRDPKKDRALKVGRKLKVPRK